MEKKYNLCVSVFGSNKCRDSINCAIGLSSSTIEDIEKYKYVKCLLTGESVKDAPCIKTRLSNKKYKKNGN